MSGFEDRKISKINSILLLILAALLAAGYFAGAGASGAVKEVRHLLGGKATVERCVSCHDPAGHRPVAGHEPLAEACTPCHNGMGLGVTAESAHPVVGKGGSLGENPEALFAGEAVSVGCLRCHPPQSLPAESVAGTRLATLP